MEYGSKRRRDLAAVRMADELEAIRQAVEAGEYATPEHYAAGRPAAEAAWPQILERIRCSVPASTFHLWIEPLAPAGAAGDTLLLAAPDGVHRWAERRYSHLIEEALADHGTWTQVSFAGRAS